MYRLLIVDDEEIIVDGIKNAIPWSEYDAEVVGCAYNGLDAFEMSRRLRPHIIICDIKMPGLSGLQLARKVRETMPETRIILISAFEEFEYAQTAIELGVCAYLVKPLRRRQIIEKVCQAIDQLRLEERRRNAPAPVSPVPTHLSGPEDGHRLVAAAKEYMLSDQSRGFGLTDVAEHVGLSPAYFSRLFKKETGISFVEYSKQIKIEKAKELLADRRLKIYEICDLLGYNSLQYFTTLFKSEVGVTPTEYRQKVQR